MSTHKALVLETKQGQQVVKDQPTPKPGKGDVLVRVESVACEFSLQIDINDYNILIFRTNAVNPVDHVIASAGIFVDKYPTILGVDGAGVI